MARPGIMLYFDIIEPIKVLPDADKGRLLVAMLEYGQSGTVPVFDGMLALAWGFVKPKIDKDEEEYNLSVLRRQYATVCRERKKKGEPEITFDDWISTANNGGHQSASMITNDNQWYPTTSTTTTTTTSSTTNTSTSTAAAATTTEPEDFAAATDKYVKVIGGELGKDVVFLSEGQIEDLLDKMGIDTFDYYVDKLSCFIIKNNAKVKNHYETILKWWQEDGARYRRCESAPPPSTKKGIPKGASGVLGDAEMEAIRMVLGDEK